MHKHSSLERGNSVSAKRTLWPDCAIKADPYRLPAHIEFEVPNPIFSRVSVNRTVSIYNSFVVIIDRLGQQSQTLRIIALEDFDAIIVRVGFNTQGNRQIGSAVYLHHQKLGLELPLYAATDCRDTAAFWLVWSRVLGVPTMSVGKDGSLTDPFNRIGQLHVGGVLRRRKIVTETTIRPAFRRQTTRQQRRMVEVKIAHSKGATTDFQRQGGSNVYSLFG